MRTTIYVCAMFAALCAGCSSEEDSRVPQFAARDGYSLQGAPVVLGYGAAPEADRWVLVTWPEVTPVAATAAAPVYGRGMPDWSMTILPDAPLDARWYALRHPGPATEGTTLVGISIADGGVVGRFFGVSVPELQQILADRDRTMTLTFTHNVVPDDEHTATDVVAFHQGDTVCTTFFLGEPGVLGHRIHIRCDSALDWSLPLEVDVVGLVSEQGRPLEPVHVVHTFADVDTDGYAVLDLESALIPPPVPTALCGGVDCE